MTFKKCFIILFFGYFFLGLLIIIPFMLLNIGGYLPITINNKPHYGWVSLLLPFVYLPFMSLISAFFNAIFFWVGRKVYHRLYKNETI